MAELGTKEVQFILGVRTSKGWPAGREVASRLECFCCLNYAFALKPGHSDVEPWFSPAITDISQCHY